MNKTTPQQEIIPADKPLVVYDPFRAQLVELRETNAKTVFDYETPAGNKDARSHVRKLRLTKGAVEKARKAEKEDALSYGRRVDKEANEIKDEIDRMIDVHEKPLDEIKQREEERKEELGKALGGIKAEGEGAAAMWMDMPAEDLLTRLRHLEDVREGEEHWQEFAEEAAAVKATALEQVRKALTDRAKHDEEQAELQRLREQQAERDRQEEARQAEERRKEEERRRKAEEERIAKEAEQRARAEAELKASQERARAEAEAKQRETELRLQAEQAERQRLEAEQRAREAEEKARREQEEKRKAEEEAARKREANKKHQAAVNNKAATALVAGGLSQEAAKTAITLIAQKAVPGVTISY